MAHDDNAALLHSFCTTDLEARLVRHRHEPPAAAATALAREAAASVPAYREFLQANAIAPEAAGGAIPLAALPLMTKDNYMRPSPLPARCRGGRAVDGEIVAFSSGSTGRPMLWPRRLRHELDVAWRFEQIFRDAFGAANAHMLAVVCFPMGTWVGGMYTAVCCRYLAQKGYDITLATPGNNKDEIFRVVEELGTHFDHTVLLGYPPFVKDVLDTGAARGIDWPRYRPKLVFAGEVFTEEWRDLVCARIGSRTPGRDTASLYGTADAGVLANETPLSICVRRFLARAPDAARDLFGESRLPTLLQYDPLSRYFEVTGDTLVITGDNGVPLIRYHIADRGGIMDYADMLAFVRARGGDPVAALAPHDPHERYRLPFVYVFGRADFTLSYYGANVYPENISVGLEQPAVTAWVSGKFVMQIVETEAGDPRFTVAVELQPGVEPDPGIGETLAASIVEHLRRLNSEFAHYVPPDRQTPRVTLHRAGDPEYFPHGVKHRYTRRAPDRST